MTSDMPLVELTAIVTGGGSGAGAEAALKLAAMGVQVCVADLNPDRAERVAAQIRAEEGEAFGWQVDVSNKFQAAAMIETTRDRYGELHILIHSAHVSPGDTALKMDEWSWRRALEVNLTGTFFCAQLCARVMVDEGGGVIVLLVDGKEQTSRSATVATSRMGVMGLGESLAAEVADDGVKVLVIERDDRTWIEVVKKHLL